MKVVEIFESIDGEGIRVGYPVTFIRFFGCNLKCTYCDSRYACEGKEYVEMPIESIITEARSFGHKRITLTGGEPLIHPDVKYLIQALLSEKFLLNIETNGAVDISPYIKKRDLIITLDYKCPSSGMESSMILDNLSLLTRKDVLKFVVGDIKDLQTMKNVIEEYKLLDKTNIYVSPVFGSIELKKIVEFILEEHLDEVRMQLQIHKFIWSPDERGV